MVEKHATLADDPSAISLFFNGQLTKILPIPSNQGNKDDKLHIHVGKNTARIKVEGLNLYPKEGVATYPDPIEGGAMLQEEGGAMFDGQLEQDGRDYKEAEAPPYQTHIIINQPVQQQSVDVEERWSDVLQLPDSSIPDVKKYVGHRHTIAAPTLEECRQLPKIDLRRFSSTWLALSVKQINLKDHLDFESAITKHDYKQPTCDTPIPEQRSIDILPGVQFREELHYLSESGLREVLQKMGSQVEPVEVAATRIARALEKNETSWVLANMASLYWRVKGVASNALDCLRVAMYYASDQNKDVALLSISNVLHRSGYINDAIVAASQAMDLSSNLVVAHFNMANLFAAKEQWDIAAMFYESTLGLQSTFEPAKQRLKLIHCKKVLQQPPLGK